MYHFPGESKLTGSEVVRDTAEMISYYEELIEKFPVLSIEDGLAEDDWDGWKEMTKRLGNKIQLVGDDLFVTNTKRLDAGIPEHDKKSRRPDKQFPQSPERRIGRQKSRPNPAPPKPQGRKISPIQFILRHKNSRCHKKQRKPYKKAYAK